MSTGSIIIKNYRPVYKNLSTEIGKLFDHLKTIYVIIQNLHVVCIVPFNIYYSPLNMMKSKYIHRIMLIYKE